jgi:TonB family protein
MTKGIVTLALVPCLVFVSCLAAAQVQPPGTPVNLDRRVFLDVNQAAPNKVLDQLAETIACTLQVDRGLPQPDISLRLSNVRARTALDAVCDIVGCRWSLKGTTLVVAAAPPPPPVPPGQQWLAKMKMPLTGGRWKLDRVPLRDVLGWLSEQMGADVVWDGPDPETKITEDLRGRSAMEALQRIQWALGWSVAGMFTQMDASRGRQVIRLEGRKQTEPRQDRAAGPGRVYDRDEPGLTMPIATTQLRPQYTKEAMRAGIQGTVVVSCVVGVDGGVSEVTVEKPLDPGLDRQAIAAARQWRFIPGTKDAKPAPVRITLELTFTLK